MRTALRAKSIFRKRGTSRRVWQLYFLAASLTIFSVTAVVSFEGYSLSQELLATILLYVCLYPTARYFARGESGVPVFSVLCLAYAVQFAIPIFTSEPEILLVNAEIKRLEESHVEAALLLSILGVLALQFGYYALQSGRFAKRVPAIDLHLNEKKAVVYCFLIGLAVPAVFILRVALSDEWNQQLAAIFRVLQNQQLVIIGILGWLAYSGRGTNWHRLLLYLVIAMTVWRGLSTAFLEQAALPIIVLFVTKWLYTKRLSVLSITAIVFIVIFLSPVKGSFREAVWSDSAAQADATADFLYRPSLWIEQAAQYWWDTFSGERDIAEATSSATSRSDLIHQFAHIYSLTPEFSPYQYGDTYSYFAVAWIPRILWPDKPKAGSANEYFAVTYALTTEEGAKRSTFGVSLLGEGYINFGVAGVLLVMALQGAILALLQLIFGGPKSGVGGQAVFLAFFVFFLNGVGTSAEIFFGNILQNLIFGCALLWWAREKPSLRREKEIGLAKPSRVRFAQ